MNAIDLERFDRTQTVTMPIVNKTGRYKGRVIGHDVENGWYVVSLGSKVNIVTKATRLDVELALGDKKSLKGYALGADIIPLNFENTTSQSVRVNFQDAPTWDVVDARRWDDGMYYYYNTDAGFKQRAILDSIKERFESERTLRGVKGATPEMRYLFILLSLQRNSFREYKKLEQMKLDEVERVKRLEEFRRTFAGRLEETIEKAGGKLVKFSPQGTSKFTVTWKVGSQTIISVIKDDMRIYNLGFCAEGEDKKHTLSSAINLAKIFQEEYGSVYITRE